MRAYLALGAAAIWLGGSLAAHATPVSFKGGTAVLPEYNRDWANLEVNYSPTARYSLGVSDFYRQGTSSSANFTMAQGNYLVKRWNKADSQTNIYLSGGVGGRHDSEHGGGVAGYAAIDANYETRRIYTLAAADTLQSGAQVQFTKIRGRLGVAPYEANFSGLQTWLIAQVDYMTNMNDELRVTPLVRLFYDTYGVEAGCSIEGQVYASAMAHF